LVPLKIVSNVSRFKPALNLNRVLADLNRGSNSLNSISDKTKRQERATPQSRVGADLTNISERGPFWSPPPLKAHPLKIE